MTHLLAQAKSYDLGGTIGGQGLGPFATTPYTPQTAVEAVTRAISNIIGVMTIAAGIWFIFQFIVGGYFWITNGGDKAHLETARHRINDAVIGLLVVVVGWAILALVSQFSGVDFLISNPSDFIKFFNIPQTSP